MIPFLQKPERAIIVQNTTRVFSETMQLYELSNIAKHIY